MASRPTLRDLVKKKKTTKVKKTAEPSASDAVGETSERSVGREKSPIGGGEVMAVVAASTQGDVPIHQPINVEGESAETENQLARRKRPLTSADKGKGKADSKKRRRREVPTLPEVAPIPSDPRAVVSPFGKELYDDSSVAAALMAKITYPGERFPLPDSLLDGKFYKEFASRQMKALAHCNRMVIACDQEVRSRQLFIDEAREKQEAERKQVAEKMVALNAELDAAKKSSNDTFKHLQAITAEKKKSEEQFAQQIAELKASHARDIEDAVVSARREAVAEVRARLDNAYGLFRRMIRKPVMNMIHLAQAEANLQLLEDMEKADAEEPFDLEAERVTIAEQKESLSSAYDTFDGMAAELKKILASGSNDGSMGLRLVEASEELGRESDDGESDKVDGAETREEATPVEPQTELISADHVVEKPLGEAASSVVPAANQEEKEDGELVP